MVLLWLDEADLYLRAAAEPASRNRSNHQSTGGRAAKTGALRTAPPACWRGACRPASFRRCPTCAGSKPCPPGSRIGSPAPTSIPPSPRPAHGACTMSRCRTTSSPPSTTWRSRSIRPAGSRSARAEAAVPEPLAGKTLGIIGLGTIGTDLAHKAGVLGMRVIGVKRAPEPVPGVDAVHTSGSSRRRSRASDFVVLLLPVTPATENVVNAGTLAYEKERLAFNFARGALVGDADLIAAAKMGLSPARCWMCFVSSRCRRIIPSGARRISSCSPMSAARIRGDIRVGFPSRMRGASRTAAPCRRWWIGPAATRSRSPSLSYARSRIAARKIPLREPGSPSGGSGPSEECGRIFT